MKSDEAGSGDCRHDCDDEESHQESLSKVTTSMMTTMTNALHWDLETGWSSSPFFHCTVGLYSGCSLVFTVLLHVILPFQRCSVKFFHIGLHESLFINAALILLTLEVALPRSFRTCASARNKFNLLLI